MAASTVVMVPTVVIFLFAQRFFMQGVVISGVKG
jgi:ABC-type glycerol-3-phosphate transport system permease component